MLKYSRHILLCILVLGGLALPDAGAAELRGRESLKFFHTALEWGADPASVLAYFDGFEPHAEPASDGVTLSYITQVAGFPLRGSFHFQNVAKPKLYRVSCELSSAGGEQDVLQAFNAYARTVDQAFEETSKPYQVYEVSSFVNGFDAEDVRCFWRNADTLAEVALAWYEDETTGGYVPRLTLDFFDISHELAAERRALWDALDWRDIMP